MKTRTTTGLILALIPLFVGSASAQELPAQMKQEITVATEPFHIELMPFTLHGFSDPEGRWLLFELQQQQTMQKKLKEIAQRTLEPIRVQQKRPTFKVELRLRAGNTAVQNWSPFPDRALDARVIRYPMPRAAAYGK